MNCPKECRNVIFGPAPMIEISQGSSVQWEAYCFSPEIRMVQECIPLIGDCCELQATLAFSFYCISQRKVVLNFPEELMTGCL